MSYWHIKTPKGAKFRRAFFIQYHVGLRSSEPTYIINTPASICTAHNYDSEYLSLTVNTNEYQGQSLKTFLSNNGDNGSATGVACGVNGKLAISESDSNSSVRPT